MHTHYISRDWLKLLSQLYRNKGFIIDIKPYAIEGAGGEV